MAVIVGIVWRFAVLVAYKLVSCKFFFWGFNGFVQLRLCEIWHFEMSGDKNRCWDLVGELCWRDELPTTVLLVSSS